MKHTIYQGHGGAMSYPLGLITSDNVYHFYYNPRNFDLTQHITVGMVVQSCKLRIIGILDKQQQTKRPKENKFCHMNLKPKFK